MSHSKKQKFLIHKHINVRFTLVTYGETKVNMDNIFKICALWCKLPRFNGLNFLFILINEIYYKSFDI
jgi:hypothetical protein